MIRLFLLAALAVSALPALAQSGETSIALRADTGKYLARCYGCVPGNDRSPTSVATVHEVASDPAALPAHARFTLVPQGQGRYALRTDSGLYMARCAGCTPSVRPPAPNEVAFVHVRQPSEGLWAVFTMNQMPNGKYTFQSDNGRYLARCENCIEGSLQPNVAMMHETSPDAAWAQWDVVHLGGPAVGTVPSEDRSTTAGGLTSPDGLSGTWQVLGSATRHRFGRTIANGDNEGFLSGAVVPAANAAGWSAASGWPGATNPGALQWSGPGGTPCRSQANYTYFQTDVTPQPGMGYELEFMNADDAARVSVIAGTSTINIPDFIGLRERKTINLTPLLAPGMTNRVVITLADVCGAGHGLRAELKAVAGGGSRVAETILPVAETSLPVAGTMTIDGTEVKTGPIQVTLEWNGPADLDLFVTDPSGSQVGWQNTSVPSGGLLDVDARASCQDTGSTVENIVWQTAPPAGAYQVMVDHYADCNQGGPVSYTATLRRNGQVIDTWTGTVGAGEDKTYTFASE